MNCAEGLHFSAFIFTSTCTKLKLLVLKEEEEEEGKAHFSLKGRILKLPSQFLVKSRAEFPQDFLQFLDK